MTHVSFTQQVWDRGVDIAVNTISGLAVAVIALGTRFGKQELSFWYDKRKRRAQREEEERFKQEEEIRRRKRLRAIWEADIEQLARRAEESKTVQGFKSVLADYEAWLLKAKIQQCPRAREMGAS